MPVSVHLRCALAGGVWNGMDFLQTGFSFRMQSVRHAYITKPEVFLRLGDLDLQCRMLNLRCRSLIQRRDNYESIDASATKQNVPLRRGVLAARR